MEDNHFVVQRKLRGIDRFRVIDGLANGGGDCNRKVKTRALVIQPPVLSE